jgi:hypothetical protein
MLTIEGSAEHKGEDRSKEHRSLLPLHAIRYLPKMVTFAYECRSPCCVELLVEKECFFFSCDPERRGIELQRSRTRSASFLFLVPYRALD